MHKQNLECTGETWLIILLITMAVNTICYMFAVTRIWEKSKIRKTKQLLNKHNMLIESGNEIV